MTRSISDKVVVPAPPAAVFEVLTDTSRHAEIDGSGSVRGTRGEGTRLTGKGDTFGMSMRVGLPYPITNTVVEFEAGKKIAWCHPGKHRWRWEVEALPKGGSRVTETFDMSTSPIKPALRLMGYPKGHQANVEKSVANVAKHFA